MKARINSDGWLTVESETEEETVQLETMLFNVYPVNGNASITLLSGFSSKRGHLTFVPKKKRRRMCPAV